ncbi:type II toxin-antitoxin system mRNA interferase toxin, RelE/StbE family [Wolbachia pipientis]|uniref:type II toxin-antitoxin system RelE family toxin n=1 Tax=Wolbachia pipientis TaxID=955 RepID=UPI0016514D9C|nr:type II toxin-antitoxin system mRNA interferase toxin, RelE/StbE family [Wolbachia pipientis]MBC6686065.1 type II toxin-antitoxin system mRNA interferase toxin, RelE/StbE family [Wolbachia pipientis]
MKKSGEKSYVVRCDRRVLKKDIPALPAKIRSIIIDFIDNDLAIDPLGAGKKLHGEFEGYRRADINNYRIVYSVDTVELRVDVASVKHRQGVYKQSLKKPRKR